MLWDTRSAIEMLILMTISYSINRRGMLSLFSGYRRVHVLLHLVFRKTFKTACVPQPRDRLLAARKLCARDNLTSVESS